VTAHCTLESCLERFRSPDPGARREAAEALAEWQAVGPLVEGLKDDNPGVQEAAIAGLCRIGGSQVVSSLMPLLRDEAGIRNRAVEVLEHAGADGLEILVPLARHADANLRKVIIDTLGKLGDARALETLIDALQDTDANVRAAAADAVGRMQAAQAVPQLLRLLHDDEWVVFSAVEALGHIGATAAIPSLIELLEQGSEPLRYAIVDALGHFSNRGECIAPLLELLPRAEGPVRDRLVKSVVDLAASCGESLLAFADRDGMVRALLAATESDDPDIVRSAINGLGMLRHPAGVPAVIRALERMHAAQGAWPESLLQDARTVLLRCVNPGALTSALRSRDEQVVQLVAEVLGELALPDTGTALSHCMSHPDRAVRRAVIKSLGSIGDPAATGMVVLGLDDEAEEVRAAAAGVVGSWDNPLRIEPLCRRLEIEPCPDVRTVIIDALCSQFHPVINEKLLGLLQNPHEEVRAAAATGMGKLRAPEFLNALKDSVNDPAWCVRAAVVAALGRYHQHADQQDAVLETILLSLGDHHEQVRVAAVLALEKWDRAEAHQALIVQGLGDPGLWIRYRAAEMLGKMQVREALAALLDIARADREPAVVREAAVRAIGRIGDTRARDSLNELMWNREAAVSKAAADALDSLEKGGEGDDPWK
jgi:HEAT repeat protein